MRRAAKRWRLLRAAAAAGLACLPLLLAPLAAPASGVPPRAVVDELEGAFIASMKAGAEAGFAARYRMLEPVVERAYDLPYIARIVLGRHWSELDAAERERFLGKFERLVVSTYAAELDRYDGHAFKLDAEKPLRRGRVLVRSHLVRPDGEPAQFDYVLHEDAGRWRIVNVVVNGVSDLAVKRTEYASLLEQGGFAELMAQLAEQIARYERPAAAR